MLRYAVSHVPFEAITGISAAQLRHKTVARDFRNDRRCCNRHDQRVARYDRLTIAATIDPLVSVDKHQLWSHRQCLDRTGKCPEGCTQYVVTIYAIDSAERHSHLSGRADFHVESLALLGIKLFGIVESA